MKPLGTLAARLWHALGSLRLTLVLCWLLAADLVYGFFCLHRRTPLFAPLNDVGLTAWLDTYGRANPAYTLWLYLLLALLLLLCLNTFVCTTDRVVPLLRGRSRQPRRRLLFKLAPHVMHYALIILLAGYLSSYLFARVLPGQTLVPGSSITLPGTSARVVLEDFDPVYYAGDRMEWFDGWVLQPRALLSLIDGEVRREALLSVNRPVYFQGHGLFLTDFAPKKQGGMALRTRITVSIRKDPGIPLYFSGMLLFTVGLLLYVAEWCLAHRGRKETTT